MLQNKSWLENLTPEIYNCLGKNLSWGSIPNFPLETFNQALSGLFSPSSFSISITKHSLLQKKELSSGLGTYPISISVSATPLKGNFFYLMGKEDTKTLIHFLHDENGDSLYC